MNPQPLEQLTIFMVTNNYTPYAGGVVSSLQASTAYLRTLGHRVIIVTLDFTGHPLEEEDVIRLYCPIRFFYKKNPMALPWRARKALKKLIAHYKPSIIHVHHPFLLGLTAYKIAKESKIPTAFTYHTLYEQYTHYIPLPQCITRTVIKQWVSRFCIQVNGLIAPSQSIKQLLAPQMPTTSITVIPSGILALYIQPRFSPKKSIVQRIELLSVSRFVPEKNIPFILQACKHLKIPFRLTLIGFGMQLPFLQKYAYDQLGFTHDQVNFAIKPPHQQIAAWYRQADLFLFASVTETQGLVLAEAMASGTPVIAVSGTGVQDIVCDSNNGFLVESPEKMAEKIEYLASHPAIFVAMQEAAWKTGQQYHPLAAAKNLAHFYKEQIQNNRS
jgi:1,2-diacylglycerol 3-alpha-glucosyltransferase